MLRLAFDFIITWRETRTRPNAYLLISYLHYLFRLFFTKKIVKTRAKGTMNKGFS